MTVFFAPLLRGEALLCRAEGFLVYFCHLERNEVESRFMRLGRIYESYGAGLIVRIEVSNLILVLF